MNARTRARLAVVTGATGGIGAAIAAGLARARMRVMIVGRSAEAGQAMADRLSRTHATEVTFLQADLSSRDEVRRLAGHLDATEPAVDVLVNNVAGVFEQRRTSMDGIEYTLALNHLGPLLTTLLLEPQLRRSAQARVIQVAADPALLASQPPDPDDLEMQRGYSGVKAYMRSKNLNVISTYELARRWSGSRITVNAYHPGIVRTGLGAHLGPGKRFALWLATPFLLRPEQGADTGIWLATSEEPAGLSGRFFIRRKAVPSAPCTYDLALSARVWARSMAMLEPDAARLISSQSGGPQSWR